jgi:hypothetical protein
MNLTDSQKQLFNNKLDKTSSTTGCWLWKASCADGYGRVSIGGKMHKAHRVSWYIAGNTIPGTLIIRHKCRSRNCVNPEHLETGTRQENEMDKFRDGTATIGEKNGNSKLTAQQVLDIRKRTKDTQKELSLEFNVAQTTISDIRLRRIWKHI